MLPDFVGVPVLSFFTFFFTGSFEPSGAGGYFTRVTSCSELVEAKGILLPPSTISSSSRVNNKQAGTRPRRKGSLLACWELSRGWTGLRVEKVRRYGPNVRTAWSVSIEAPCPPCLYVEAAYRRVAITAGTTRANISLVDQTCSAPVCSCVAHL